MTVREAIQILWDYMQLGEEVRHADCIVGFGCYNEDIARCCAQLYHLGMAPIVVFSGGLGRNTASMWAGSTEAARFAAIAESEGVPHDRILLEDRSTNSAENLQFTRALLAQSAIKADRILAVHKPYMERRLHSAFPVYWPEAEVTVTSYRQSYDEYVAGVSRWGRTEEDTIAMLAGDFARISRYAQLGYQIPQEIPPEAWEAFSYLCQSGYTGQLPG